MTHFSTYQELLAYKYFSKKYEHDALIIGLLPVNDFFDNNLHLTNSTHPQYIYRYRPYLIKEAGEWVHFNYTENFFIKILRRNSHIFSVSEFLIQSILKKSNKSLEVKFPSYFYDFDKSSLEQLVEILKRYKKICT